MEEKEYLAAWKALSLADNELTTADLSLMRKLALWQREQILLWQKASDAQEEAAQSLQTLVRELQATQQVMRSLNKLQELNCGDRKPIKNGPGRPRKEHGEFLLNLIETHKSDHGGEYTRKTGRKMSDRVALTEYFRKEFKARNARGGRADTLEFQAKLKNYKNAISSARSDLKRAQRLQALGNKNNPEN